MKKSEMQVTLIDHMGNDLVHCSSCLEAKSQSCFSERKDRSGRLRPYCKECSKNIQRARYSVYKREQPFKLKATRARSRAQSLKVPYDLDAEYLESIWTGTCPVFHTKIYLHEKDRADEFAAELDRFIPDKGYVKGNVHFLSRRANRLKNNVTVKELRQLIEWMKKHEDS